MAPFLKMLLLLVCWYANAEPIEEAARRRSAADSGIYAREYGYIMYGGAGGGRGGPVRYAAVPLGPPRPLLLHLVSPSPARPLLYYARPYSHYRRHKYRPQRRPTRKRPPIMTIKIRKYNAPDDR